MIGQYRKAIVAAVTALITMLSAFGFSAGEASSAVPEATAAVIDNAETLIAAAVSIGGAIGVWAVPNKSG
jgi:hypothetical protein